MYFVVAVNIEKNFTKKYNARECWLLIHKKRLQVLYISHSRSLSLAETRYV
jgi:hypothetical protein